MGKWRCRDSERLRLVFWNQRSIQTESDRGETSAHLFQGMVLDGELYASRLVGNHDSTQQLRLQPNFPTLSDHHSFGVDPGKVRLERFDNVYVPLVKHQSVLSLICDSHGGTDFISDRGEA